MLKIEFRSGEAYQITKMKLGEQNFTKAALPLHYENAKGKLNWKEAKLKWDVDEEYIG